MSAQWPVPTTQGATPVNDHTGNTIARRNTLNQRFNWHLDLFGPERDAALDHVDHTLRQLDAAIAAAKRAHQ